MQTDIRDTELYREAELLWRTVRRPGTGQISDAAEVHVSSNGQRVAFSGTLINDFEGVPPTRICLTEVSSGDTRVVTFGPNVDRSPKFSPDGSHIAFLSDRHRAGDFQLYLLDPITHAARAASMVEGWVEYLHWSPGGRHILLGVAGHGADISGGQGAVKSRPSGTKLFSWMPTIDAGDESHRWRRAWVYDLESNTARPVSLPFINVWEAVWCGPRELAAVVSPGPSEGLWYSARLHCIDLATGESRELFLPNDQIGWPASSPSGKHVAIVEGVASDRWVVAGELRVIETESSRVERIDTHGVDITYAEWRSQEKLLLAGHREFETVVGIYDMSKRGFHEVWVSRRVTGAGRYVTVAGFGSGNDCVLVGESFTSAPELALIREGEYRALKSFDLAYREAAQVIAAADEVSWNAVDGLLLQGWLLRPKSQSPHPLILNVHGGPVWHWRPQWLGRSSLGLVTLLLLKRGYAVFFPNPRGSAGRGQEFARRVCGDMGGTETTDHLSGLDYLVKRGIADPNRLGVTGVSHGGFMTSWLITQDTRFAAAVSVAPVTNQVTQRLISNIPQFVDLFLADTYTNLSGKYFQRSPVMHAHNVKTPTLNICGAQDRCTPPEEAAQFHNALLENGVKSVLVTYPEEGHGVRKIPASVDYAARVVGWFHQYIGAQCNPVGDNSASAGKG